MANFLRLTAVVLCALAAVAIVKKSSQQEQNNSQSTHHDELVCITPKRIEMAPRVQTLCFAPNRFGPHGAPAEILIYANQIALDYRREHPNAFEYPVGSKFVKEKFAKTGDKQPDAATIMENTATNRIVADWRFSSISLPDKTLLKSADNESCAACHREYGENGYISGESEKSLKEYLKIKE